MKSLQKDLLRVEIFDTRAEMGRKAAEDIAAKIAELLAEKEEIRMIFAAAPSQNEVLENLLRLPIAWERIRAYHMDEYIGLSADAPQGFGNFLRERLFGKVPFRSVDYIDPTAKDAEAEARRYAKIVTEHPADIVVLGIGENGHIAFNDPPVADFADPLAAKVVALDEVCRTQQVHDGCFADLADVPTHAVTLTVPTLTRAPYLFCIVPAPTKAAAVYAAVCGPIGEQTPATALRRHKNAILYLDRDSAGRLPL